MIYIAVLIVLVGALLWWRIGQMEARLRQQIDSYGATVGDLVDYVEKKLGSE